ncbi:23140_t:CDS:1, partial [Cetraspora pellucida]
MKIPNMKKNTQIVLKDASSDLQRVCELKTGMSKNYQEILNDLNELLKSSP